MEVEICFYNPQGGFSEREYAFKNHKFFPQFGIETWIDQSYFILKRSFPKFWIRLVDEIPDSGIIIVHSGHFPKDLIPNLSQLFICIAADYGRNRFAQVHLFQNHIQTVLSGKNKRLIVDQFFPFCENRFIPHWPQPGIKERKNKISELKRIGYFGRLVNFESNLISKLKEFCKENQLIFETVEDSSKWNNYEKFDLILAIRSFEGKEYLNKPFSKVVNAILAGVPVIAGNESSALYFKEYYYTDLPIVSSEKELFSAILTIKENYVNSLIQLEPVKILLRSTYESDVLSYWIRLIEDSQVLLKKWMGSSTMVRSIFIKSREL